MTIEVKDILGNILAVGDTVVVAFPNSSSSAHLRVGKIVKIDEKKQPDRWNRKLQISQSSPNIPVVSFEWDKELSSGYVPDSSVTKTEKIHGRFVKIK